MATDWAKYEFETLALSVLEVPGDMGLKAIHWFNLLHKLGAHAPLVVVHDLGVLWGIKQSTLCAPNIIERAPAELRRKIRDYRAFINSISQSEVIQRAQRWRLSDRVIAVLITRILGEVDRAWRTQNPERETRASLPLNASLTRKEGVEEHLLSSEVVSYLDSYLQILLSRELQIRHSIEQLDLDTLRLLGMFERDNNIETPLEMVDLLRLFNVPTVNDIVNFSLQIIPSILESTQHRDAQFAAMDGYEGVDRLGHLDSLMLSEFAYDEEIFNQKFLDHDLFYYARSRAKEEKPKLHYLLIDASASMRGQRSVFARGVALGMVKKWMLLKERPLLRFFDSQLYQPIWVDEHFSVPYLLSFKSERGRHYARVFEEVLYDVQRLKEEKEQDVVLYILTHGQCHIPQPLISRLAEVAFLYGIFIRPGHPIEIDYLSLLGKHRLIEEDALQSTQGRKQAAMNILLDLSTE